MIEELWNGKYSVLMEDYFKDNAKKLNKMVDKIFRKKYGGTSEYDMPEFYSVAIDVCVDIVQHDRYDKAKGSFAGFLYGALGCAIIDELKKQARDKRVAKIEIVDIQTGEKKRVPVQNISIDAPLKNGNGDESCCTLSDLLQSDFKTDDEVINKMENDHDVCIRKYLYNLPRVQREIIQMKMDEIPIQYIKDKLGITQKEYESHMKQATKYEYIKILIHGGILR